jgi:hypothetical protein
MPSNEVAKVFERINSTGTDLTIVDLARAATWSPEFDLKDEIETLLLVLDGKQYGRVDAKTMLRTIAAGAGFGFSGAYPVEWTQGLAARFIGRSRNGFDTP